MFYRTFPKDYLRNLAIPWSKETFHPHLVNGYWRAPKKSLKQQADLRKAAVIHGVDPVGFLGMPDKDAIKEAKRNERLAKAAEKPMTEKMTVEERRRKRKEKVKELMLQMPKMIKEYREERAEGRKRKSNLPW